MSEEYYNLKSEYDTLSYDNSRLRRTVDELEDEIRLLKEHTEDLEHQLRRCRDDY